jgi:hypothetical protein
MYLFILIGCILICILGYFLFRYRESFTAEDLNVQISKDNGTITLQNGTTTTVPPKIKTSTQQVLEIKGDMKATVSANIEKLTVTGTSNLGTATATSVKIGNATLTNNNGSLNIDKNVRCNQATVSGDLTVNGHICIESGGSRWYFVSRDAHLHISKDDPNRSGEARDNQPYIVISPNGNIWLSRSNYPGWITNSLNEVRNLHV